MPIFDFKCKGCAHEFEKIVRHGDTPACPSCQSTDLEQLVSVPGIGTQKSRQRNLALGHKEAGLVRRDKAHAQREYEANYIKDHS